MNEWFSGQHDLPDFSFMMGLMDSKGTDAHEAREIDEVIERLPNRFPDMPLQRILQVIDAGGGVVADRDHYKLGNGGLWPPGDPHPRLELQIGGRRDCQRSARLNSARMRSRASVVASGS
ncbi:hypothetical protein ACVBEQ_05225 [Nakamurella sp. GG22]